MDEKIKVIIAEDHPAARKLLTKFIKILQPSFEIIDEAENGHELIEKVLIHRPNLVLVDIEMPHLKGIDAIRECLKFSPNLKYIFTTAYDAFAIDAFDLKAVDYVVKPIQKERLFIALERAKQELSVHKVSGPEKKKRIPVHSNRSLYFVPTEDILFIEKSNRKSIIHTLEEQYPTSETLEVLKEYLDDQFFQSHRSFLVNLEHISQIKASGKSYLVYFYHYETPAQISKQKIKALQEKMENYM
ncbi:LytTR family DNA-binding domain-containing protein [Bacillus tianshenii]|nr:LytTR family DNA-binding domain-containing protein [Bacillus tianshenii]